MIHNLLFSIVFFVFFIIHEFPLSLGLTGESSSIRQYIVTNRTKDYYAFKEGTRFFVNRNFTEQY